MDGQEPQVRDGGVEHQICGRRRVEPLEQRVHLAVDAPCRRRPKVHPLAAHWARHHLHRPACIVAPVADADLLHAAASAGEQRCMPAEQALLGDRLGVVARRVESHLDHAVDVTTRRSQSADVDAEPTRHRRANLRDIELLTFDRGGPSDVAGDRVERRLLAQGEPERLAAAEQHALLVAQLGEVGRE